MTIIHNTNHLFQIIKKKKKIYIYIYIYEHIYVDYKLWSSCPHLNGTDGVNDM